MAGVEQLWQAKTIGAAIEDEALTCFPDSESDSHPAVASSDESEHENQQSEVLKHDVRNALQKYSQHFGLTTSLEDYMNLGRLDLHSDVALAPRNDGNRMGKLGLIAIEPCTPTHRGRRVQTQSHSGTTAEDSDGEVVCLCHHCHLPRGEVCYKHEGNYLHGECLAQVVARDACSKDANNKQTDRSKKQERRKEYHIGWDASKIPRNDGPASKLALKEVGQGMVCLVLQNDSIRVASTSDPTAALNLEYLSTALQVRHREGHEPVFSLNPVDANQEHTMQSKVFIPEWLAGTSVGDVLFEADYYLKELSMGEYDQPVLGMKSCSEHCDLEGYEEAWQAREWFMVRKAEIRTSDSNILVPYVQMGVEAREQVLNSNGLQDAPVTRSNHPMVKYAEQFSHFFDLIAERKSVIFHLRELAKASVVAKYVLDANIFMEDGWFNLQCVKDVPCSLEVPQLWNEELKTSVEVEEGALVRDGKVMQEGRGPQLMKHGVYGGVAFGLDKFKLASGMDRTLASGVEGLRMSDFGRSGDMRMRGSMAGLPGKRLQGVDLRLDQFDLSVPRKVNLEVDSGSWDHDIMSLDECAPVADSFWSGLCSNAFREDDAHLLRAVFNERISDRRSEGDLFVPPDGSHAYVAKLRGLLQEETNVLQRRKNHFASKEFAMDAPGALFPRSWSALSEISKLPERPHHGSLHVRDDMTGAELTHLCQSAPPVFERSTEDGIVFRIYRIGSIEVRTSQDPNAKEYVEAVFSIREPALHSHVGKSVEDSESIAKVIEFVEHSHGRDYGAMSRPSAHYYVVLETETGRKVVTELMESGRIGWQENPPDLTDRNSLAKVVRIATCATPILAQEIRSYKERMEIQLVSSTSSMRKQYAKNVFGMATNCPRRQEQGIQKGVASKPFTKLRANAPPHSSMRRSPFRY